MRAFLLRASPRVPSERISPKVIFWGLEAKLAPEGKPFLIWAMIEGRRMTKAEIDAAFQEAIASRRASRWDKPLAISWKVD
jgi:hypothetical protein